MAYKKTGVITQSGADTFTAVSIDTNIAVDGKSGWEIVAFSGYWSQGEAVAAADWDANLILATQATATVFSDDEEIYRLQWGLQNTGGVAVAVPVSQVKRELLLYPRLTVQPALYVHASTQLTGAANVFYYEISYEIVKLSDIEVLRLLQGGA